jgi:dipeptidase E
VTERHIVAMGGGGFSGGDPLLDRYVLDLTTASRPKVCFVPTASGDSLPYQLAFFEAFPAHSFDTSVLHLVNRDVRDVSAFLGEQDVIYVGGGNTANMLAIWRIHGVDVALRRAWEAGVVCCGMSAGANCWFEASTTDSFLIGRSDPLPDGLGFLAGSFCPHYHSEPLRRPEFGRLVASGELPPGIAADDSAAAHFIGTDLSEAVASKEGAAIYRLAPDGDGESVEEKVPTRLLR